MQDHSPFSLLPLIGAVQDDRHAALWRDVAALGELLLETVEHHEGEGSAADTEDAIRLAARAREGDPGALDELRSRVQAMDEDARGVLARSLAHFMSLANIAEQHHRIRRRRAHGQNPATGPQPGSIAHVLARLTADGVSPEELHRHALALRIELVLTAHPTQVNRRTMLRKLNRVEWLLDRRDCLGCRSWEALELNDRLRQEISSMWLSDEVNRQRITPLQEARSGLLVFEQALWQAVPHFARELDTQLLATTGQGLPLGVTPFTFGSWMGGDRDGNPNVTAEITRRALALGRSQAAALYMRELDRLWDELSVVQASDELRSRVGPAREPYRALIEDVHARMKRTLEASTRASETGEALSGDLFLRGDQLRDPLMVIWRSLHEVGAATLARGRLLDIIRRLDAFGLCLVRLDLRQHAARHTAALDEITRALQLGSYTAWTEQERQHFLLRELSSRRPLLPREPFTTPETTEVLDAMAAVADAEPEALGAYVISMARAPSDVLAVELLQREQGVATPLPAVPLFETLADLEAAGEVVGALLDLPVYRAIIAQRGDELQVMLGYSDSSKDAGLVAASWALYRAQEDLSRACRARGVSLVLFHGRGGSVGRGGAPAHAAILALPPGSFQGAMRVTEQGEVIQAKLGIRDIAVRNLELYASAALEATLRPPVEPEPAWRAMAEQLAACSKDAFRATVAQPDFVPYFRAATPEPELGGLKIGSRPARRKSGGGLDSLRAIPWVFAWTQARLMLPAWLGVGEALDIALASSEREVVLEMAQRWPWFGSLLSMVEMVLAKVDLRIHALYAQRLTPTELQPMAAQLEAAHARAVATVIEAMGHGTLLETDPVLARALRVRSPFVDPLNVLQVELLASMREAPSPGVAELLAITVNGISAGMKNTG